MSVGGRERDCVRPLGMISCSACMVQSRPQAAPARRV